MANNQSSGESAGNAIKVISITVSIIVLGLGGIVYLLDKQFEIAKRQDEFEQRKADKSDMHLLSEDRFTGTMQRLHSDCVEKTDELREKLNDSKNKTQEWKAQYDTCRTAWELHMKVCKCKGAE